MVWAERCKLTQHKTDTKNGNGIKLAMKRARTYTQAACGMTCNIPLAMAWPIRKYLVATRKRGRRKRKKKKEEKEEEDEEGEEGEDGEDGEGEE